MDPLSEEDVLEGRLVFPLFRGGDAALSEIAGVPRRFRGIFRVEPLACFVETV